MDNKEKGVIVMPNKRFYPLDYIKLLAVLLVMNSHLDICYVKYPQLSTGGILGDALFFFASGFGLLVGTQSRFDDWYKRRIRRIYPSIISASVVSFLFFNFQEYFIDVLICKRYWFIGCILGYYLLIYPIMNFCNGQYISHFFYGWLLLCFIVFFTVYEGHNEFYAGGLSRCLFFFLFMLQGAIMGKNRTNYSPKWWYLPMCILCVLLWASFCKIGNGNWLYFLSIIPFLGFVRYIYLLSLYPIFQKIYESRIGGFCILTVSQLCLECYLIQKFCYSDVLNCLFPVNIPIFMAFALLMAYIVKVLAKVILQTFDSKPFNWRNVLSIK